MDSRALPRGQRAGPSAKPVGDPTWLESLAAQSGTGAAVGLANRHRAAQGPGRAHAAAQAGTARRLTNHPRFLILPSTCGKTTARPIPEPSPPMTQPDSAWAGHPRGAHPGRAPAPTSPRPSNLSLAKLKPRLQAAQPEKLETPMESFEHNTHRMNEAPKGKIGRLPQTTQEQFNRRWFHHRGRGCKGGAS